LKIIPIIYIPKYWL